MPGCFVWSRQFKANGNTLALLHRAMAKHFDCSCLLHSFLIVSGIMIASILLTFYNGIAELINGRNPLVVQTENSSTWRSYATAWILLNHLVRVPIQIIFFGLIWLIHLASRLNAYDIQTFAAAVGTAFNPDDSSEQILPALSALEVQISSNLYQASCGWVKFSLYQVLFLFLMKLILFVPLIRGTSFDLFVLILTHLFQSSCIAILMMWPLASTSTAYEIHVIRGLNNASILHLTQRHLTSQFLLHIKTLNWGFLIGDEPLRKSMVTNAIVSVCIALCVGTTNGLMNQV